MSSLRTKHQSTRILEHAKFRYILFINKTTTKRSLKLKYMKCIAKLTKSGGIENCAHFF